MAIETHTTKGKFILAGFALVTFLVGILIGHLITPAGGDEPQDSPTALDASTKDEYAFIKEDKWEAEKDLVEKIINRIDPQRIKENLRYLSAKPHLAASARDVELATHIRDQFETFGFDVAKLVPYNILLSKPDQNNPNKITLMRENKLIFQSNHMEVPLHPDDSDPNFIHAFLAYTPAGTVTTPPGTGLVYVNFGREEDFQELERLGVNATGSVVIVRSGKVFRANKVRNAELAGAISIIIYSDPMAVASEGVEPEDVYPNSQWLPETGMERGTAFIGDGDPLTPGWPATEHAYRLTIEEADLPKIPAQPLGYADAKVLLEMLGGQNAPESWQGGLPNLTYKIGPSFIQDFQDVTLKLSTHNSEKIEEDFNVIGIIKGSIEPDRYVLFGNHRDAWGYGAIDPSSATAQLLETARVYGTLLKEGWKPRRSIVFCSWGAEEYGLLGSNEWVEHHLDILQSRAVAYVNTDICAYGSKLLINASPLLWDLFYDITAMIPGVEDSSKTLFDEWKQYYEQFTPDAPEKPVIGTLGSGSDHASFNQISGTPSVDLVFEMNKVKYPNISIYPYYHTGYETFYMVSTFVDPEFKVHQGCGRITSLALKHIADSSIIPYSIERYPQVMKKYLKENKNRQILKTIYDNYDELENAVDRFLVATQDFQERIKRMKGKFTTLELRGINDQLMKLEQSFIIPEGLPGRPTIHHAVFASSQFDSYASDGFPGLSDLLYGYEKLSEAEKLKKNSQIKRHISDLTIMTDRATSLLKENHLIE